MASDGQTSPAICGFTSDTSLNVMPLGELATNQDN